MEQQAAYDFVNKLINALYSGDIEFIKQSYSEDLIAHYGAITFTRDDVINRAIYNVETYEAQSHHLLQLITFDNVIVYRDRQMGMNKQTQQRLDLELTGVYRLRGDTIVEAWLLTSATFDYKAKPGEHDGLQLARAGILQTDFSTGLKSFTDNINQLLAEHFPNITITEREMECLFYTVGGRTAKETAKLLALSPRTIEHYLDNLKSKFNCSTKSELRNILVPEGIWL